MDTELDKLQIVVGRYKEPLNWLKDDPFNKYSVIVYNKGNDDNYYKSPNMVKEVVLPNSGLEVHSFLYHIINNYDNLSNITAFFQGSIDIPHKYFRAKHTIEQSVIRNTSVLAVKYKTENVKLDLYDFTIDHYKMSHQTVENNKINEKTYPCKIRPFGKWYEELFGDLVIKNISYQHIIAIKREHILRKPKAYYENLITYLEDIDIGLQPEAVHYFERAWSAIFHPLDENINYIYFV